MMDFKELNRGGTAPLKSKPTSIPTVPLNPRPKTRSVDNEIIDTNLDLRNNRYKPGNPYLNNDFNHNFNHGLEITDWSENHPTNNKRAPSRGKASSKDPRRGQNTLLGSGLSAYTQNVPQILMNPNQSRKSSKPSATSSNASPRVKDRNKLSDLRAAYGTDIPLGKPSSPGKAKYIKQNSSDIEKSSVPNSWSYDSDEKIISSNELLLNAHDMGVNSINESELSSRSNSYNPSLPGFQMQDTSPVQLTRKTKKVAGLTSLLKQSKISGRNSPSEKAFVDEGFLKPMGRLTHDEDHYNRVESPQYPLSHISLLNKPLKNTIINSDYFDDTDFIIEDTPSSSNISPIHPLELIQTNSKPLKRSPSKTSNSKRDIIDSSPTLLLTDTSEQTNYIKNMPQFKLSAVSSSPEADLIDKYTIETNSELDLEKYTKEKENNFKKEIKSVEPTKSEYPRSDDESQSGQLGESTSDLARPQSRKLYLGNEKSNKDISISKKTPKSAGARYGSYSPLKSSHDDAEEEGYTEAIQTPVNKKLLLKKLSSYNDLHKNSPWKEGNDVNGNRPPSRQSSAFPVHLADDPNSMATMNPTTPSKRRMESDLPSKSTFPESDIPMTNTVILPNTELHSIISASQPTTNDFNKRPPSRQKIAAQHLFDETSETREMAKANNLNNSGSTTSVSSSRNIGTAKPGTSQRMSTTRSNMMYDPKDDGFIELDPEESLNTPFTITISYGDGDLNSLNTKDSKKLNKNSEDAGNGILISNKLSDLSLGPRILEKNIPIPAGPPSGNPRRFSSNTSSSIATYPEHSPDLAVHNNIPTTSKSPYSRPKSQTSVSSKPHPLNPPNVNLNLIKAGKIRKVTGGADAEESDQLRSKSANNYSRANKSHLASNESIEKIPMTPSLTSKGSKPTGRPVGAWSEIDPRNIPRAQVILDNSYL